MITFVIKTRNAPIQLDFKSYVCIYPLTGNPTPKNLPQDFPGGPVVKNPPANAGDTGSIPGLGRVHVPRSN